MARKKADIEDGYTRIANSIMQALYTLPILSRETRVLLFIIYQTFGYNHKERELSNSYIAHGVGIEAKHVSKIVQKFAAAKIIIKQEAVGRTPQKLSINTMLSEWQTIPKNGDGTIPKKSVPKNGDGTIPKIGDRTIPNDGDEYNTDKYKTDKYKTECVGASPHNTQNHPVFCKLWREWKWSQASMDKVPLRTRNEIESIGYLRMSDAAKRYQLDFDSRTTKNNQPLSARSWFTGAYVPYLPPISSSGIWYNIDGHKCKGEREYF